MLHRSSTDRTLPATQRIMGVKYSFPSNLHLSRECVDLISKVFQANPGNRISIAGIRAHPWFLKNLPEELLDGGRAAQVRLPLSSHISAECSESV